MTHEIHDGLCWRRIDTTEGAHPRGTVLYIHGLGESGLCFESLMGRSDLAGWTHLAPDLAGYGKSPWPQRAQTLKDLSESVLRRLREPWMTRPVILVGHSMGGVIGQEACERGGRWVDGFVNVEGNISLEDCGFSGPAAAFDLPRFVGGGFTSLRDTVYDGGRDSKPERGYYASLRLADPSQFHFNSVELVQASAREDLARRFAALQTPRKAFVAGLSGGLGARSLELLRNAGVDYIGFERSGHWPFIDQEDRFAEFLVHFLDETGPPVGAPPPVPRV